MDHLIIFNKATDFLKNPPTLSPRTDFVKLHALRKHMVKSLKELVCPQSAIHRWSGMILPPIVYTLLKPNPFVEN
jgi:hypothetical protein